MIKERSGGAGDGQPFPMYKFSVRAFFNSFLRMELFVKNSTMNETR